MTAQTPSGHVEPRKSQMFQFGYTLQYTCRTKERNYFDYHKLPLELVVISFRKWRLTKELFVEFQYLQGFQKIIIFLLSEPLQYLPALAWGFCFTAVLYFSSTVVGQTDESCRGLLRKLFCWRGKFTEGELKYTIMVKNFFVVQRTMCFLYIKMLLWKHY